jgi:hypothetical protein
MKYWFPPITSFPSATQITILSSQRCPEQFLRPRSWISGYLLLIIALIISAYLDLPLPSHTITPAMRNLLRIDLFTFFLHPSQSFPVVGTAITAAFSPGLLARHDLWAVISCWESGWPQLAAAKQSVGTFPAACLSHMDHSASCRISPIVRNSNATCEQKTSTKLGVGPLARCSFEETETQFIDAAVFAEKNHPGLYSIGRVLFPLGSSSA